MAYAPHVKVQWGGSIYDATVGGSPIEVWSCTLSLEEATGGEVSGKEAAVADRIAAYHGSIDTGVNARCALEYVKVNRVGPNGRYVSEFTTSLMRDVRGGLGSLLPIQTALRVTLDNASRNPRARGGWYVPCYSRGPATDYRIPIGNAAESLASAATLVNGLNALAGLRVCVASGIAASNTAVTRIRVGRRTDVMRSRANNLREEYQAVVVA